MQAIRTKYYPDSNHRPSRIIAKCEAGQLTLDWNSELNIEQNHKAACEALLRKLGWLPGNSKNYKNMFGGCFEGCYYWVQPCDYATTNV